MNFSFKRLLLSIFLICEIFTLAVFPAVAGSDFILRKPDKNTSVFKPKISFSFTIARKRDCEGFGICDWTAEITLWRVNNASGFLSVDESNRNMFVIEIDKTKGVTPEGYSKYFQSGTFLMEDESPIPGEMLKALGVSGTRTVLAGKHKVTEKNGILYVYLPVK